MPPRAAAQKASKLAAAQLESSPPPSFGEPSKPRTPVRVTYARRRRGPSSPTKSSDGSPGKGKNVVQRTRPSLSALISPSRVNARSDRAESPSMLLSEEETEEDEPEEPRSPLRQKTARTKESGSGRVPPAHTPSAVVPGKGKGNAASATSSPAKRKRAISISSTSSLSDFDGSDLTSLSSTEPSGTQPPTTRARSASTLTTLTSSQVSRAASGVGRTNSLVTLGESGMVDDEPWGLGKLGTLAWVRVNGSGEVVTEHDVAYDSDTYWWPAKVTHPLDPLTVSLFGDGPCLTSVAQPHALTVTSPSASNILPMASRGRIRFSERSYKAARGNSVVATSPRKRRKLDVDTRWKEARDLMLQEDEDANEGLPMLLSSHFNRDASFSLKAPSARGSKAFDEIIPSGDDDTTRQQEKPWRPPACDIRLEIPGELVLAKEKKTYTDYWPAKLLEYIPPLNAKQRPRYKALFYDGLVKNIDADWFFTAYDGKDFANCKLGQDLYNYGLEEDRDDVTSPLRSGANEADVLDDDTLREATPEPVMPPPEDFEGLLLEKQFEYVKPVLAAVVERRFMPANERHDQFMRGAAARRTVCESGYTRGSLTQDEVEGLLRLVRRWATRRGRRRELGVVLDGRGMGPRSVEDGASGDSSQVPPADNPVEKAVASERQPAESQTELTVSGAEESLPSQLALSADADAHDPPPPDEATITPPSQNAQQPVSGASEVLSSPETIAAASGANNGELHIAERGKPPPLNASQRPRPGIFFEDLSAIDQITYCQNILLHEAVLQLLLWRSGERTDPGLMTEEEERRLHDIAFEKANESDWVHEIIRLKQAAEGKMLPWANNHKSKSSAAPPASTGGTRTRPRRG